MLSPNSAYIDGLYADYLHDPHSVSEDWREYFQSIKNREESGVMERTSLVEKESIPISEISSINTVSPSRSVQSSPSIPAHSNEFD